MSDHPPNSVGLDDVETLKAAAVLLVGDDAADVMRLLVACAATVLLDTLGGLAAAREHAGGIGPALTEAVEAIADARLAQVKSEGQA